MALNAVVITETFTDSAEQPLDGTATFTPNVTAYASGVPVLQAGVPVQAQIIAGQLRSASSGTLQLLATDNDLRIEGLTGFVLYTVQVTISGQTAAPWSFFLPWSIYGVSPYDGAVDLYALANTPAGGGSGGDVTSVFGRAGAVTSEYGDYDPAQVGAVSKSGDSMAGYLAPEVITLTDASPVEVNAALGNDFRLVMTSAVGSGRAIGVPSNPRDGQKITFELVQPASGGPCAATWAAGTGGYSFGSGSAPVLSTGAGEADQAAFRYSAGKEAWLTLGGNGGF